MQVENTIGINSYKKINIIFSILIIFIFFYTYLLPYLNITLKSSCEGLPLVYCKSKGLTRAFSQILRFNIEEALILNPYSFIIFTFFLIQLFTRNFINFILTTTNYKNVVMIDVFLTSVYFIFSFVYLIIP